MAACRGSPILPAGGPMPRCRGIFPTCLQRPGLARCLVLEVVQRLAQAQDGLAGQQEHALGGAAGGISRRRCRPGRRPRRRAVDLPPAVEVTSTVRWGLGQAEFLLLGRRVRYETNRCAFSSRTFWQKAPTLARRDRPRAGPPGIATGPAAVAGRTLAPRVILMRSASMRRRGRHCGCGILTASMSRRLESTRPTTAGGGPSSQA